MVKLLAVVLAGLSLQTPDLAADSTKVANEHPVACHFECQHSTFVKFCHGREYRAEQKTPCGALAELLAVCDVGAEICP